jgi:DNA-binding NarL/FixJ family response regulator
MFRMGLAAAIGEMDAIELVGQAQRADEVAELVAATRPDVLLVDIRPNGSSPTELTRCLVDGNHDVGVVVLSMSEDYDIALMALRDGARGYLAKDVDPQRLELAVRVVAGGDVVLDRTLAAAVSALACERRRRADRPFPQLTEREFEVLSLLADGLSNSAIARTLVLSQKTVRNHVSNVLAKLHAADRSTAIVVARRAGLSDQPAVNSHNGE